MILQLIARSALVVVTCQEGSDGSDPSFDVSLDRSVESALAAGSESSIRGHVRFLASDICEGRSPGTRGGEIAARYLATQLEILGLEPGGLDGTYYQKVPLLGMQTDFSESSAELVAGGQSHPLKFLDEFVGSDLTLSGDSMVDAPVVFVGYGISAPEQNWDDYKGVDVAGKVLLMLVNDPPSDDPAVFGGKGLTYYGRWTYKYEEAARRGAVGAILVHRTEMAGYGWQVVRNSWGREKPYVDERGSDGPRLKIAAWISDEKIASTLAGMGVDLDQLIESAGRADFQPQEMDMSLKVNLRSSIRELDTSNVAALLRGRERPDEVVVYTSHYDHLGTTGEMHADNIYNGAVDNATGCGALLEIARMFKALPELPDRSILFLFVTAEEGGLRGSQYYVSSPTFPLDRIAANINLDSAVVDGEPLDYEPLGYDRSTLKEPMELVAELFSVGLLPDSRPEHGIFYRSDHFSFAKVGVPAVYLKHGMRFAGRGEDYGMERSVDFVKNRYHQPSDEFSADWDFGGTLKTARIAFALGLIVAEDPEMPEYFEGDEFRKSR